MNYSDIEKAKTLFVAEIIEYVPNSVVTKTIIKKTTGNLSAASFDTSEIVSEKTVPFDSRVQIIDGKAEIVIDGISNLLDAGQSIIIPANTSNIIRTNERFKMITTIHKSSYE